MLVLCLCSVYSSVCVYFFASKFICVWCVYECLDLVCVPGDSSACVCVVVSVVFWCVWLCLVCVLCVCDLCFRL